MRKSLQKAQDPKEESSRRSYGKRDSLQKSLQRERDDYLGKSLRREQNNDYLGKSIKTDRKSIRAPQDLRRSTDRKDDPYSSMQASPSNLPMIKPKDMVMEPVIALEIRSSNRGGNSRLSEVSKSMVNQK